MPLQRVARRAAGIALVSSLYIIYTCLHYVAATGRDAPAGSAAALLTLVVPLFLVLPLTGWAMARRTAAGPDARCVVGVARTATLIAVAVWVASVAFLRFGLPGESGYPSVKWPLAAERPLEN